jgi:beta-fructofuranosidase
MVSIQWRSGSALVQAKSFSDNEAANRWPAVSTAGAVFDFLQWNLLEMMHMKKNSTFSVIAILFLILCVSPKASSQWTWSFEECYNQTIKEKRTGAPLRFMDTVFQPGLVEGVQGKGLRTTGYSGWVEGKLPAVVKAPLGISGWFALESYPTDTAAFFSLSNTLTGHWLSACLDRFGRLLIGEGQGGKINYIITEEKVKRFEWLHVSFHVGKTKAQLLVNGRNVLSVPRTEKGGVKKWNYVRIGKDEPLRNISVFPLNVFNGIIDEITIGQQESSDVVLATQQEYLKKRPDLSIPASRFANDFNRPQYHLLPAANWTNETHGLFYHNGRYHIFNQKNGNSILLRQINWGHFSSPDLVRWTEHRPALTPEPGSDNLGIWSGHAVVDEKGIPVLIYTAGNAEKNGIGLAYPKDSSLVEWVKYSGNPVIDGQPEGFTRTDMRDPYVFKEGDTWYMIIGYGIVENGEEKGTVLLYKSPDLKHWKFLHPLFAGDPANDDSGVFWEMPVFWKLNGQYILQVNKVPHKGRPAVSLYWTGKFENEKFVPDEKLPKRLEVVNRLLSPSVALDAEGRTTAIAIIPDEIRAVANYRQGWAHLFSVPRVWTLQEGVIHQQPHPALKKLRLDSLSIKGRIVTPTEPLALSKGKHQVEINVQVLPKDGERFGFFIGKNTKRGEWTKIYVDRKERKIVVDQTTSSKRAGIPLTIRTGDYTINPNEVLNIHLFIDGSVAEVFINGKDAFTTRFFPHFAESNEVEIFCEGGSLQVINADVWELKKGAVQTLF